MDFTGNLQGIYKIHRHGSTSWHPLACAECIIINSNTSYNRG